MTTQTVPADVSTRAATGTRFTPNDITDALYAAATDYAKDYAGTFAFMCDMRRSASDPKRGLSDAQASGTLNCWVAELRRSTPKATATPTATATEIRDGIYTVVLDEGSHRTLRVRHGRDDAATVQFVSYLSGPDNESSYTCCGYVKAGNYSWTRKFANETSAASPLATAVRFLLSADTERRNAFGRAYALESGNCYVCNRTLTDPLSIELGIGPVCRENRG